MQIADLVKDTFNQQNLLRSSPDSFIPDLEALLKLFKGNVLHRPGEIPLMTNEGPGALKECISFLRTAKPLPIMTWSDEMSKAAQGHADDIGPKSIVGHSGSDGSTMSSRLEKYGDWEDCLGENIDFGGKTGREVICNLMVDDGNATRGHRKNIFNGNYRVCGVGAQKHGAYKICVVLDYAGGYCKKGQQPKDDGFGNIPQGGGFGGFPQGGYGGGLPQGGYGGPQGSYGGNPQSYQPQSSLLIL